uniref:Uncharacterized protein n=1 Tax=Riboviria sp. TaxID=2585031 RepID=A0A514D8J8_9VIRU|nr:MAG: hypothetical protein H3RhizoLitter14102_000002 [Riboviria sp.]
MSSENVAASAHAMGSHFEFEHAMTFMPGEKRWSKKVSTVPIVTTLKQMYTSVELVSLEVDVVQLALIGTAKTQLYLNGACFVGLIPTAKDTDADTGTNNTTVLSVPKKHAIQLSSQEQTTRTFKLDLKGYELDLAQDPRRGQGPVFWIGNTGIGVFEGAPATLAIMAVVWRGKLSCSGTSTLW